MGNPRVRDKNIYPPQAKAYFLESLFRGFKVGNVKNDFLYQALLILPRKDSMDFLQTRFINVRKHHRRPCGQQTVGDTQPDRSSSAGDQGDLPTEGKRGGPSDFFLLQTPVLHVKNMRLR